MATEITVIPLPDAAKRLGISLEILTSITRNGTLRMKIIRESDGQISLTIGDIERMAKALALREQLLARVAKFDGETVSTQEAREVYGLSPTLLYSCIKKGIIRAGKSSKGGRGIKRLLNKADVMYVLELSKRGQGRGHRLFTPDTLPPHID